MFRGTAASEQMGLSHIMTLKNAFDSADTDKGGSLEEDEFERAFGKVVGDGMNHKQITQLFMKIDANSDGAVDWKEFMNYMLLENETLSSMKLEKCEYKKSNREDPSPNKEDLCHKKMITSLIILNENEWEEPDRFNSGKEEKKNQDVRKKLKYITASHDIKIWDSSNLVCKQTINTGKYQVNAIIYMTHS